jgi:hypothetical protein
MAEIKCPMCSKPNPAELDVCQYCEARLKPLTDELSRSQPPIHPGEEPTEKSTGELEDVLPQWLREVRQQARDSVEDEPEQAPAEEEALPEESADLLAGLQSQVKDDEEIPDWLADLRGEGAQPAPEESSVEEGDLASLKNMLGEETSGVEDSEAGTLPGWISDLDAGESEAESGEGELSAFLADRAPEEPAASGMDFGWDADFETDSGLQADSTEDESPIDTGLPAWLQGAGEETKGESESDLPDWMSAEEPAQVTPPLESEEISQLPSSESDTFDWSASLGEETAESTPQEEAQPAVEGDMPDWLASLGEESAEVAPEQEEVQPAVESGLPDWLASLGEEGAETPPQQEVAQPAFEDESPDWLASSGEETSEVPLQEEAQPTADSDMPDWLSSMSEAAIEAEGPPEEAEFPASLAEEPPQEASIPPAFVEDEGESLSTDDVEALFAADMPDWLSGTDKPVEGKALAAPDETTEADLSPAELPSWVQAMRPVEAVISDTGQGKITDQYIEESGPLAGLRGVLPAVQGAGPSSIPKAYSIKLQASEDQQSSASMLEQMLATEVKPKPIATQPVMLSQRLLRWIIAIVLLVAVGSSIFTGSQVNPMPFGVSPEIKVFLEEYVSENLPANAPVLVIFDYDAALAGELEAAAAPLIDYVVLKKAPRLSLISSTPTGPGLAEQFMSLENTQASVYYQAGQQFVNLGYLPGGAAGVLAFAINPVTTKTNSTNGENAWETPVLEGVSHLSDFAVIILLSDDVETSRIWIEQTETARKDARFVVVSSAQSGPMILPYLQSGQVDAMLTGLDGGAPIEQFNGGRPGTARRYWDAYGLGLLAALVMIAFGSLWSLVSSWRERRREQGEV